MTYIENKDSSENNELISTEKQDEIIVLTDYKYIDDNNSYIYDTIYTDQSQSENRLSYKFTFIYTNSNT